MNQVFKNTSVPEITEVQARKIAKIVVKLSGVQSGFEKPDFIRTRLSKRLMYLNCSSFDSYLAILSTSEGKVEEQYLVEALTTHTTSFFRENAHFEWIENIAIPELTSNKHMPSNDLTFWSAAVSTGAELWSAAMTFEEYQRKKNCKLNYKLIGTDISRNILKKASSAVYSNNEIKGIPESYRSRYLLKTPKDYDGPQLFKILPKIQKNAKLLKANLMALDDLQPFKIDIVMLRNVLIYFNQVDQKSVAESIFRRLRPGGFLITAHTESLRDMVKGLTPVGNAIYQKTII